MSKAIEVDTKTFIRFWLVILGFAALAFFIFKAWTGLLVVGLSAFLAIAIRPLAKRINGYFLKKKKRNKEALSSVFAFLIVVSVFLIAVSVVGPVVVSETSKFVAQLPHMFENTLGGWDGINNFGKNIGINNLQGEISSALNSFTSNINIGTTLVSSVSTVAGIFTAGCFVIVLTLLFLLEGPKLYDGFWNMLSGKRKDESVDEARRVTSRMAGVISTFVSKQVTIAILDGAVVTVSIFILSLIFGFSKSLAFPMGLVAMIAYLIPMFGQIIGCALIFLMLLFSSPLAAIIYVVFYIVYVQVEGNGIAPKIQGDALSLSPLIVLCAIVVGMYVSGLFGAIIAIPLAGCIKVLIEEYPRIKEIKNKN